MHESATRCVLCLVAAPRTSEAAIFVPTIIIRMRCGLLTCRIHTAVFALPLSKFDKTRSILRLFFLVLFAFLYDGSCSEELSKKPGFQLQLVPFFFSLSHPHPLVCILSYTGACTVSLTTYLPVAIPLCRGPTRRRHLAGRAAFAERMLARNSHRQSNEP